LGDAERNLDKFQDENGLDEMTWWTMIHWDGGHHGGRRRWRDWGCGIIKCGVLRKVKSREDERMKSFLCSELPPLELNWHNEDKLRRSSS